MLTVAVSVGGLTSDVGAASGLSFGVTSDLWFVSAGGFSICVSVDVDGFSTGCVCTGAVRVGWSLF